MKYENKRWFSFHSHQISWFPCHEEKDKEQLFTRAHRLRSLLSCWIKYNHCFKTPLYARNIQTYIDFWISIYTISSLQTTILHTKNFRCNFLLLKKEILLIAYVTRCEWMFLLNDYYLYSGIVLIMIMNTGRRRMYKLFIQDRCTHFFQTVCHICLHCKFSAVQKYNKFLLRVVQPLCNDPKYARIYFKR